MCEINYYKNNHGNRKTSEASVQSLLLMNMKLGPYFTAQATRVALQSLLLIAPSLKDDEIWNAFISILYFFLIYDCKAYGTDV